jgi:hypothetical protein
LRLFGGLRGCRSIGEGEVVIRKTVQKYDLDKHSEIRQNLEYWLSRPPEERLAAVDALRREYYGDTHRLQRVARVISWEDFITNKNATGRTKEAADIEALGD